jgi:hypothetical protein
VAEGLLNRWQGYALFHKKVAERVLQAVRMPLINRKTRMLGNGVKGGVKLDHWGGGKLDQMSVWEMGISTEGGVWSGGLRSDLRTAFRPERKTSPSVVRYSAARDVAVI